MHGYNFTTRVREVLAASRVEAAALGHEYIGTEHILLALLRIDGTVAHLALTKLGIDPATMRDEIAHAVSGSRGSRSGPDLPYSSRAKLILEQAMLHAHELDASYVGTEHLLLALITEKKGIAAQVLQSNGITFDRATEQIRETLATTTEVSSDRDEATRQAQFVRRRPAAAVPSERVRAVVNAAYELASSRGSHGVEAAHVAIALLDHADGIANAIFSRLALDVARARVALDELAPAGVHATPPETPLQLDEALFAAFDRERSAARATEMSTAHLALALLDGGCPVAPVFADCGVTRASFSEALARISG